MNPNQAEQQIGGEAMTQHRTPGLWTTATGHVFSEYDVFQEATGRLVANCGGWSDGRNRTQDAEKKANARFIVQACNSFDDLLEAAKEASRALHEYHPQEFHMRVGQGICAWGPCKRLFDATAKANSPRVQ